LSKNDTPERNRFLILDIGGGYLKGGVLEIKKKEKFFGEIVVCKKERRESFFSGNKDAVDYEELKDNVLRLISSIRNSTKQDLPKNVILCFDQIYTEVKSVVVKEYRDKPKEKIDLAEMKNILQHAFWNMRDRLNKNRIDGDVKILDAKIQEITIDGYKIINPIDFEGKEISFVVGVAAMSRTNYEIVRRLSEDLKVDISAVYSDVFCAVNSQTQGERSSQSFLFVDFGASATQLALVKKGGFEKANYFNMGTDVFTKKVVSELGVGFSEAEEIMIKYCEKKLSEYAFRKIDKMIENEKNVWQNGMLTALEEMGETGDFPKTVLMTGGGSKMPFAQKFFEKNPAFLELFGSGDGPAMINYQDFGSLVTNKSDSDPQSLYFNIFSSSFRFLSGFGDDVINQNFRRILKLKKD
jgi:cell division protein FtsA